jgi:hypothetical protein
MSSNSEEPPLTHDLAPLESMSTKAVYSYRLQD